MIPLVDAYIRDVLTEKIKYLKTHPDMIQEIFNTLGSNTTLKNLKKFVVEKDIRVLMGYPRDDQSLPCYVISIAVEDERPIGLGDNIDDYEEEWDENELSSQYVLDGVYFNAKYRIECWSDNGDLTSYLYIILKWCLLSARHDMLSVGLQLPSISGADLEPVPEYMTTFVYRRSMILSITYENLFIDTEIKRGDGEAQLPIGVTPDDLRIRAHYNSKGDSTNDKPTFDDTDILD